MPPPRDRPCHRFATVGIYLKNENVITCVTIQPRARLCIAWFKLPVHEQLARPIVRALITRHVRANEKKRASKSFICASRPHLFTKHSKTVSVDSVPYNASVTLCTLITLTNPSICQESSVERVRMKPMKLKHCRTCVRPSPPRQSARASWINQQTRTFGL